MNKNNKIMIITKTLLVCILLFGNINKTYAAKVAWNKIVREFERDMTEVDISIASNDTSMNITGNGEEYSNYSLNFKYENDTISLIPRNKNDFTEEKLANYGFVDVVLIGGLLAIIVELYGIDDNQIEEDKLQEYGINFDATNIEYTDDFGTISGDYVESFSINLNTFETKIESLKVQTPKEINTTNKNSNNNNNDSQNVKNNPQTGTIAITFAWIIGVIAVAASVLYFKQIKNNESKVE